MDDPSELLPHGGQIRFPRPLRGPERDDDPAAVIAAVVEAGIRRLCNGSSPFAADVEPVGEPQIIEYFDVMTGEYVVTWIVWCKERAREA